MGKLLLALDGAANREGGTENLGQDEIVTVLELMEMQRQAMLMYTSCGWFFNDLAGLETVQILRYAARAMDLYRELGEEPPRHRRLLIDREPEALFARRSGAGPQQPDDLGRARRDRDDQDLRHLEERRDRLDADRIVDPHTESLVTYGVVEGFRVRGGQPGGPSTVAGDGGTPPEGPGADSLPWFAVVGLVEDLGMIGAAEIAAMKKGAYLINNSRGTVVDLDALAGKAHLLGCGHG